jgi:predicted O-methyltransferase YrrM
MEDGLENDNYQNFAKNCGQKFDFIIIDSLKRFECAKNVIDALKPCGTVILDDSERKNYKKIFEFFAEKNFQKQDFFGIAPGQLRIKNTTFFFK